LQYTDSVDEDESEEETIRTGTITVQGEDGQQYILLEVTQLGDQGQIDNASTSVSIKQADKSSCKYKFKFKFN